jgi:hypothetical protein
MRESKIEGYLRTEIAKLGGWMQKMTSPGTKGPPDNIVMWPDRPHPWHDVEFIETKAPKGKLEMLQQRDHTRRRAMGFVVHVIWTMEQAEQYLRSRGKK